MLVQSQVIMINDYDDPRCASSRCIIWGVRNAKFESLRVLADQLLFTCNYVVSVGEDSLFLWVLGMGYLISLWHPLSAQYNHFVCTERRNTLLDWFSFNCRQLSESFKLHVLLRAR